MYFKQRISQITQIGPSILPSSYQIIGNVLLFKLPKIKSARQKVLMAKACLKLLPYVKTVCEIKGISGEYRKPRVKILAGKSTETLHKENNCVYKLDAAKIMFSKGNLSERKRLLPQIKKGEVIVDAFAGIGYFSIGLAKFTGAKRIYSVEKNKVSFDYLRENARLNRLENIAPVFGDFRKIKIPEKADRILLGYLPKTHRFLTGAFGMLKSKGIVHYHDVFSEKDLWEKPAALLEKYSKKNGFSLEKIKNKKIVKSYGPHLYHVVLDATFSKTKK